MDQKNMEVLKARARRVAYQYGFSDYAEAFASEVVGRWYLRQNATVEQLFIDYIRQEIPGSRSEQPVKWAELGDEARTLPPDPLDPLLLAYVGGTSRAMLLLATQWGFEQEEIAELFGVDPSLVSQRFLLLQKYLQAILAGNPPQPPDIHAIDFACDNCKRTFRKRNRWQKA
jgi:DNA-directed RNA polymerase specialized sigma24 family protein